MLTLRVEFNVIHVYQSSNNKNHLKTYYNKESVGLLIFKLLFFLDHFISRKLEFTN